MTSNYDPSDFAENHPLPGAGDGDRTLPSLGRASEAERQAWISAYLDGEVSPSEAQAIALWLDAHPDALREVEHLRRTWDLLEAYPDEPVPEGFAERVLDAAQIDARRGAPAGRVLRMAWYRRPLAAAAALLLAFGGGALLWSLRPAPVSQPGSAPTLTALEALDGDMLADDGLIEVLVGLDDETFDRYLAGDFDDLAAEDQG